MTTTHTKGPWDVTQLGDGHYSIFGPSMDSTPLPEDEDKANARLIAAAPELLEVLKDAMQTILNTKTDLPFTDDFKLISKRLLEQANKIQQAIQKATQTN